MKIFIFIIKKEEEEIIQAIEAMNYKNNIVNV